jgi:hypothetical protein
MAGFNGDTNAGEIRARPQIHVVDITRYYDYQVGRYYRRYLFFFARNGVSDNIPPMDSSGGSIHTPRHTPRETDKLLVVQYYCTYCSSSSTHHLRPIVSWDFPSGLYLWYGQLKWLKSVSRRYIICTMNKYFFLTSNYGPFWELSS